MAEMGLMPDRSISPFRVAARAHIFSRRMAAMVELEDREVREEPEGLEAEAVTVASVLHADVQPGPATGGTVTMAAQAATEGLAETAATGGRMATAETSPYRSANHSQARSISTRPVAMEEPEVPLDLAAAADRAAVKEMAAQPGPQAA
jgi:hypothetical protein